RRDLASFSEIRNRVFPDVSRASIAYHRRSRRARRGETRCGRERYFPGDVLHHRADFEFQKTLGGGDWKAGACLRRLPVWIHYLDRAGDFMALLSRHQAARGVTDDEDLRRAAE